MRLVLSMGIEYKMLVFITLFFDIIVMPYVALHMAAPTIGPTPESRHKTSRYFLLQVRLHA
jgi:hypothetical protein